MSTSRSRALAPSRHEQAGPAVDRLFHQADAAGIRLTLAMAEGLANGSPRMIAYVADLIAVRGLRPAIETRHDGGQLEPGKTYTVNENGPETVIGSTGDAHLLGNGSPALVTASHPGMVLPVSASRGGQALRPVKNTDDTVYNTAWHGRLDEKGRKIWDVAAPDPNHELKRPDHPDMSFETFGTPEHPFEMGVDVDGAPNAYPPHKIIGQFGGPDPKHPGRSMTETITEPKPGFPALDNPSNAYSRRKGAIVGFDPGDQGTVNIWDSNAARAPDPGLAPVQKSGPYKGYPISKSGYSNGHRYVDGSKVDYIVGKGEPGDLVIVHDLATNQTTAAIVGDTGNSEGEGSLALHQDLGNTRSTPHSSGQPGMPSQRFIVRVYKNSHDHKAFWADPSQANVTRMANNHNAHIDFSAEQATFDKRNPKVAAARQPVQ